jgi:hypothetical protein
MRNLLTLAKCHYLEIRLSMQGVLLRQGVSVGEHQRFLTVECYCFCFFGEETYVEEVELWLSRKPSSLQRHVPCGCVFVSNLGVFLIGFLQ